MSSRTVFGLKISSGKKRIEDSIPLRVVVAAAVMVSMGGLVAQDIVTNRAAATVLIMTPVGFVLSWYRRHQRNIALKVILAAAALMALADFLSSLSGASSVEAARAPLAEIFLWVQMIHSFDLPRRKDLHFSLASSVTLMALGGSLSFDSSFLMFFVPWGVLSVLALQISHRLELIERFPDAVEPASSVGARSPLGSIGFRGLVMPLALVVVAGSVAFMFAPRIGASRLTSLAFQIPKLVPVPRGAGILNPGMPGGSKPGESPFTLGPDTYFGFGNFVDLRSRGNLSHELVMRVRASRPAFWRGGVYDIYSESSWSDATKKPSEATGLPVIPSGFPFEVFSEETSAEMIQTFYVEKALPNIVFSAYRPTEIWFPLREVEFTDNLAVRAPALLEEETVYSVVSRVPTPDPELLKREEAVFDDMPQEFVERYTQLPPELPARVRHLANQVAGGETTILGKVNAIDRWLQSNTRYLIDIPPQPRGSDAVDHFLFEDRRGFCEQIASSMAIMLRSQGVPARLATGFAPGERNILSGYFEVRRDDAHSWVEVFFPGVGWMEFDPTHEVPQAEGGARSTPGFEFLGKALKPLKDLIPDGTGKAVGAAMKRVLEAAVSSGPRLAGILVGGVMLAVSLKWLLKRASNLRRSRRLRTPIRGAPDQVVLGAFRLLEDAGTQAGVPRGVAVTPEEYASQLLRSSRDLDREDVMRVVSALEKDVYAGIPLLDSEARVAEESARRVGAWLLRGSDGNSRVS